MSKKKIAIIGECMVELSGAIFGEMQQNFGGDTMNTAIYMKKLASERIDVNYVTVMGEDALSQAMIARWQDYQVNCDTVLTDSNKHAGLYMIQTDAHGERTFQYWRNDSAAKYLVRHAKFADIVSQLKAVDAVYLSGISLAILPIDDCNILLNVLAVLKVHGVKIIYDSNHRPTLWASQSHCQQSNNRMYQLADLALVTFEDEAQIWGFNNLTECREHLHQQGVRQLVIKTGEKGCQYSENSHSIVNQYDARLVDNVVDTTAAGDSFNAGFLSYWLLNHDIASCAEAGNLVAGQVIQQRGAIVPIDNSILNSTL